MLNTYNIFATTIVKGKIILQPKLHEKILSYVNEKIISSPSGCTRSVINGYQFHNNFDEKKELNNLLDQYFLKFNSSVIKHAWLNVLDNKSYNKPHVHIGDNIKASGILYLSNNNNNITFVKDDDIFEIKPKLFDYLLFPYNLAHYVLPEERSELRISYAFNLEYIREEQ
jgi:hypothetical protein|tara:strand:- start:309 stop:818 length:510 start_codon:yes stop_codon:yes gene_type:complete